MAMRRTLGDLSWVLALALAACGQTPAPGGDTPATGGSSAASGGSGGSSGGSAGQSSGGALGTGGAGTGGTAVTGGTPGTAGAPGTGGEGGTPDGGAPADGPSVPAVGMVKLFDGTTLTGWDGNPQIWSVKDGAIDGLSKTGGELIYTKGDYDSFRLTLESRLVSATQHLGVCFWGDRSPTWGYANCVLVIPPSGGMWDYHKGVKSPPHTNPAKANVAATEWHKSEILANAKTGEVIMAVNGVQVLIYKNMSGLKKGPIGLQIHNGSSEVQYRALSIEENPTDLRLLTVTKP
jgi:hypothetical protein